MKVEDLKSLSSKIIKYAQNQTPEEYFENFFNLLQQVLQNNPERPLSEHKNNLFTSLRSFDLVSLTYGEKSLFQMLSYDNFVGSKAITEIEEILYDEKFDPAGVLQNIEKKFRAFKEFIDRNKAVQSALQLIPTIQETYLREGEALLEITFSDETSIDNIGDIKWIDQWTKIIRAFSELVGGKPEHARIVSVQKSSPLIVALAIAPVLAITLEKAINMVLATAEKYFRMRTLTEEICRLNLENTKILQDLSIEATSFMEKSIREITNKLTEKVLPQSGFQVQSSIRCAVKSLFDFLGKGGRVNCPYITEESQIKGDVKEP
jgi:hypothetical protein